MLRLDVVQLCFSGASRDVEQEVELVQVSALHADYLTGVQLHHFGAFYRGSWRVNDWIHGRMDGACQVVRMLLSPERLRQRGYAVGAGSADEAIEQAAIALLDEISPIAVPATDPDQAWFKEQWAADRDACLAELRRVVATPSSLETGTSPPPNTVLDACARAIARPIQTMILRDELPALAKAICVEEDDAADGSRAWLRCYVGELPAGLSAAALWRLWDEAYRVGAERILSDLGSDTFAQTTTHAAAVLASAVGAVTRPKVVGALLKTFRGYALTLWATVNLLTRKSRFGARAVELAVAAGGVIIAMAILVPGMPFAFTLAGILLLLAGLSAAALLDKRSWPVGWRLAGAAVLVATALGGYAYWDYSRHGSAATIWGIGIKAGVVLLVVLLGWWLAQAQPARRTSSRRRPAGDPQAHRRPTCEQASGKAGEAAGREATGR